MPASAGMTPIECAPRPTNVIPAEAGTQFTEQQGCGFGFGTSPRMTVGAIRWNQRNAHGPFISIGL